MRRKRQAVNVNTVLLDTGFKVVSYESGEGNKLGRTTYHKDNVWAVVNHNLPYHVFVYNGTNKSERKLWNLGRTGEVELFIRLLERVGLNDNAPTESSYLELTHDEFENLRAYLVQTNMTVIDGLHHMRLSPAAYNIESINGRLYASGLDKCASCQNWEEDRDLSIQWLCETCQERNSRQLAIRVHC